jgi:hypothetical protein
MFAVKKEVFRCLQRVAVAKTLSPVILAYGLGISKLENCLKKPFPSLSW